MPWHVVAIGHTSRYRRAETPEPEYPTKLRASVAAVWLTVLSGFRERYAASDQPLGEWPPNDEAGNP